MLRSVSAVTSGRMGCGALDTSGERSGMATAKLIGAEGWSSGVGSWTRDVTVDPDTAGATSGMQFGLDVPLMVGSSDSVSPSTDAGTVWADCDSLVDAG